LEIRNQTGQERDTGFVVVDKDSLSFKFAHHATLIATLIAFVAPSFLVHAKSSNQACSQYNHLSEAEAKGR